MRKVPLLWILPVIIFVAAWLPRSWQAHHSLPYARAWDEPFIMNPVIRILKSGDWNPHFQIYPNGYVFAQTAVAASTVFDMAKTDEISYITDLKSQADTKYLWTISHPQIYLRGRLLTAFLGSLMAVVVFFVARRLYGPPAGLVAGLALAFSEAAVSTGSTITVDIPSAFFIALSLLFAIRMGDPGARKNLLAAAAGACIGAATGIKYNGALGGLLFLLIYFQQTGVRGFVKPALWIWAAAVVGVFLLFSPFSLLDFREFMVAMIYNFRHYAYGSHNVVEGTRWDHLLNYLQGLKSSAFSLVLLLSAAVGVVAGLRMARVHTLALALFAIAYVWYFSGMRVHFFRNMAPVFPVLAILIGAPFGFVWSRIRAKTDRALSWKRLIGAGILGLVALAILIPTGWGTYKAAHARRQEEDSRQRMLEFLATRPETETTAVDVNLHLYVPKDYQGTKIVETNVFDKSSAWFEEQGIDRVVAAENYGFFGGSSDINTSVTRTLGARFAKLPVEKSFGNNPLSFGQVPVDVKVNSYRIEGGPALVGYPENELPGLAMSGPMGTYTDFNAGAQAMWAGGVLSGYVTAAKPVKELVLYASGTPKDHIPPEADIVLRDTASTKSVTAAKKLSIAGWGTYLEKRLPVDLRPGTYKVEIHFTNGEPYPGHADLVKWRILGIKYITLQ